MTKRKKTLASSPTISPYSTIMESDPSIIIMAKLDIMGAQLTAQLNKSEQLEAVILRLAAVSGQRKHQERLNHQQTN